MNGRFTVHSLQYWAFCFKTVINTQRRMEVHGYRCNLIFFLSVFVFWGEFYQYNWPLYFLFKFMYCLGIWINMYVMLCETCILLAFFPQKISFWTLIVQEQMSLKKVPWEFRENFCRPVLKCCGGPKGPDKCCRHFCNPCRRFLWGIEMYPVWLSMKTRLKF